MYIYILLLFCFVFVFLVDGDEGRGGQYWSLNSSSLSRHSTTWATSLTLICVICMRSIKVPSKTFKCVFSFLLDLNYLLVRKRPFCWCLPLTLFTFIHFCIDSSLFIHSFQTLKWKVIDSDNKNSWEHTICLGKKRHRVHAAKATVETFMENYGNTEDKHLI
jgi:hypothetical protein